MSFRLRELSTLGNRRGPIFSWAIVAQMHVTVTECTLHDPIHEAQGLCSFKKHTLLREMFY